MASPTLSPEKTLPCDEPGSLVRSALALLRSDKRSRTQLSIDLDIPFHWLNSFIQGSIEAPSVNRVQYICEKLTNRKVKL